ncbi:MAG: diaminopimelate epimerase [Betaproteobacteria bacterium RIFCSPLOWO2_02_67_12]|nr:MAG: diaminopimelate epimerase [Betaproteobacteria bacterium RIFCSPLOWO2_02_67_12]OGA29475.1 MAG: diaminopimelate epimerase [Betaproteobacteria bacterium RIFCSPLOWO2_02_FULL_68_150]
MRRLAFSKMEGAGNDFVVVDATTEPFILDAAQLRRIADRHFGIGCDQILVVEPARGSDADFRYRVFNADGGEVEQCGNGARCFVKFVHARGLTAKSEIRVETLAGVISPRLEADGEVSVDMGLPRLEAPLVQTIDIDGAPLEVVILSMGNPHAVQQVADVDHAPVASQGPRIEHHPRFPHRVNAGFMQVLDRHAIRLRVYERGAGETLACGTGACAAVVSGVAGGLLDSPVRVEMRGGTLTVSWAGEDNSVWMKGPARAVFEGVIELEG